VSWLPLGCSFPASAPTLHAIFLSVHGLQTARFRGFSSQPQQLNDIWCSHALLVYTCHSLTQAAIDVLLDIGPNEPLQAMCLYDERTTQNLCDADAPVKSGFGQSPANPGLTQAYMQPPSIRPSIHPTRPFRNMRNCTLIRQLGSSGVILSLFGHSSVATSSSHLGCTWWQEKRLTSTDREDPTQYREQPLFPVWINLQFGPFAA
jgi:hypothetical protein